MKKKDKKWVVADFETTTEEFYNDFGNTQVWLYAISDNNGKIIKWGKTIEEFMKYCELNLNNYIIYFHNLKFDGSFILNYLIDNKFGYIDKIRYDHTKKYNTLISEEGQFYQININFKRGARITIHDSLKLLPFKVKQIAESFKLPMKKGNIDYSNYAITEETLEYVFNDVSIVALALKEIKENGMNDMTTASCAYHNYEKTNIFMNSYFPILEEEFLIEYRNAYRGGRSQVNPLYANAILKGVKRFDINSMYPYVMYSCQLPFGKPIEIKQRNTYKFELYTIRVSFKLKDGHLPTLLKKGCLFGGHDSYYTEILEEPEIIHISSIDFDLLEKHYDIIYLEFIEMWGFNTCDYLFRNYIDYWYKVKQENKGAKRQVAKLMLNSLYGKFGSNCKGKMKLPYLNDNGELCFTNSEEQNMRKYYLPIAIAITSYAHKLIDDGICATGYDKFVYCDTDSIHTLGDLPSELIDNTELGKFKLEGIEHTSKYVRQKTYVYTETDNKGHLMYNITCAGMDDNSKQYAISKYKEDIFNVFGVGFTVEGFKLLPRQVKGGVILCKTSFKITA